MRVETFTPRAFRRLAGAPLLPAEQLLSLLSRAQEQLERAVSGHPAGHRRRLLLAEVRDTAALSCCLRTVR